MLKLKTVSILAALLACAPAFSTGTASRDIPIMGRWEAELPGHFMASTALEADSVYTIRNNTPEPITVWLLDDRTPLEYFPLMKGETRQFSAPWDLDPKAETFSFDLFFHHSDSRQIKNVSLQLQDVDRTSDQ